MKEVVTINILKEIENTRFLGFDLDSSLSWKDHIDKLMFKPGRACYASRYVKHFMSQDTLRTVYFSYFHSILIIWHNFLGVILLRAFVFLKFKKG